MGKFEKKKPGKSMRGWMLPAVAVIGCLAALIVTVWPFPSAQEQRPAETQPSLPAETNPATESIGETKQTETTAETRQDDESEEISVFPIQLEDGKLLVESLFPFEGINPDCGNLEGSAIAAIMIRNVSDQYINSATLLIHLEDGTQIAFSISDLPAGGEMLAFSADNSDLPDNFACVRVESEAEFSEICSTEGIGVAVDGISVTVTNETAKEMTQIDIYCHGVFGTSYYGGATYRYTIEKLNPGESASVTVTECILGVVDVVRVCAGGEK